MAEKIEKLRQLKALENFVRKLVLNVQKWEEKEGLKVDPFPETITFWRDGRLYLSAECNYSQSVVADYYGEFRDGYAWINEKIEKRAEELGLCLEWENPGCVGVYIA